MPPASLPESRWPRLAILAGCDINQKLRLFCNFWNGFESLLRSCFIFFIFFTCAEAGRRSGQSAEAPASSHLPQPSMWPAPTFPLSNSSSHSSMTVLLWASAVSRMASWLTAEISPCQVKTAEQRSQQKHQAVPHCIPLHQPPPGPRLEPCAPAPHPVPPPTGPWPGAPAWFQEQPLPALGWGELRPWQSSEGSAPIQGLGQGGCMAVCPPR